MTDTDTHLALPGQKPGEGHALHKLTETQVLAIRERYAAGGTTMTALATEYGVAYSTVQKIIRGRRWAVAPNAAAEPSQRPWTERENTWLRAHADAPLTEQARHFRGKRSISAIMTQRSRLGIRRSA